jgi:hypothetical protein
MWQVQVYLDANAIGHVEADIEEFLDVTLGPLITADAIRYAPKHTGALAAGIGYYADLTKLIVFSAADYTLDVEFGHRVFHRFTGVAGPEMVLEEPFLRPALYKYRSPDDPDGTPPLIAPGVQHTGRPTTLESWIARHSASAQATARRAARRRNPNG